jgi:hypothetical protein
MACTQLLGLQHPVELVVAQRLFKQIAAVAVDQVDLTAPNSFAASMTCCTIGFPAACEAL